VSLRSTHPAARPILRRLSARLCRATTARRTCVRPGKRGSTAPRARQCAPAGSTEAKELTEGQRRENAISEALVTQFLAAAELEIKAQTGVAAKQPVAALPA